MRFGLHIADVVVQGDDLVGDGVNLAARIQAAAEPDSIYVSGALFDHVRRNSAFIFDDIGERAFKNIAEPVHLYRVRGEIGTHRLQSAPTQLLDHQGTAAVICCGACLSGFRATMRTNAISPRASPRN